jgi:hypothetical protein
VKWWAKSGIARGERNKNALDCFVEGVAFHGSRVLTNLLHTTLKRPIGISLRVLPRDFLCTPTELRL